VIRRSSKCGASFGGKWGDFPQFLGQVFRGNQPRSEAVPIQSLLGPRERRQDLIQSQTHTKRRITAFRIMYIMLKISRYYGGLLKLLLASLLPLRGSKDKASIDACAST